MTIEPNREERLADEMGQWEIHALRNVVTQIVVEVQLWAREHPEVQPLADKCVSLKDRFRERQEAALNDPAVRHDR